MPYKTLVCLDGSKLAEEVLPYIIESGPVCRGEIILLHVSASDITIPPPESMHVMTFGRSSKPDQVPTSDIGETTTIEPKVGSQLKSIEREQLEAGRYLERIALKFSDRGLKVRTAVTQGEVGDAIVKFAVDNKISLITLTAHGHGGPKSEVLGRVAQSVLKFSPVPVLLVRPAIR